MNFRLASGKRSPQQAVVDFGIGPATIDSGGELVQMAELAARIAKVVRPDAVINRDEIDARDLDRYHSDGQEWERRCQRLGFGERLIGRYPTHDTAWATAARVNDGISK